jgi:hypothetical protein
MDDKALRYIGLVNDHQQFPAARVHYGAERGETIYMYQQPSSSTAESMNAENKSVRDCTSVDPINSMLLLLKLEPEGFPRTRRRHGVGMRFLHHMGRSCLTRFSAKLIRATTLSQLMLSLINMCVPSPG